MVIYRDERGGGGGPVEISILYCTVHVLLSKIIHKTPSPSITDFISPCVLLKD